MGFTSSFYDNDNDNDKQFIFRHVCPYNIKNDVSNKIKTLQSLEDSADCSFHSLNTYVGAINKYLTSMTTHMVDISALVEKLVEHLREQVFPHLDTFKGEDGDRVSYLLHDVSLLIQQELENLKLKVNTFHPEMKDKLHGLITNIIWEADASTNSYVNNWSQNVKLAILKCTWKTTHTVYRRKLRTRCPRYSQRKCILNIYNNRYLMIYKTQHLHSNSAQREVEQEIDKETRQGRKEVVQEVTRAGAHN